MNLLYVSGTYYPAAGGAEIGMHILLKEAVKRGHDTLVATDLWKKNLNKYSLKYDDVKVVGLNHDTREKELSGIINSYAPDWIITQLMWSDIALKIAKEKKIKSILSFCKVPAYLDINLNSEFSPTEVMAISDYVKNYVDKTWNRQSIVILPLIEMKTIMASEKKDKQYITMFNPNLKKGGAVFRKVALQMPSYNFSVVDGWDILKNGNETNVEIVRRLCESSRIEYKGQKLDDISFRELENVTKFPCTDDVSKIYAQTRILCVPSQWQEAFGRVAIEAMANSIPVLGSKVGGLAEIVKKGGILIDDYANPDEWISALKRLDDQEEYNKISQKGKLYVEQNYDYDGICDHFFKMIER